jgi:hypothetical protein
MRRVLIGHSLALADAAPGTQRPDSAPAIGIGPSSSHTLGPMRAEQLLPIAFAETSLGGLAVNTVEC